MIKRICDILGGGIGLLFFCALFPFVGAAIVWESGFPILVRLERISAGKSIRVYKFRSMVRGADRMKKDLAARNERSDGPLFKIKDDPRLTRVGKFLRKLRIDEVPQFMNVLTGDLSLVGPRPHEPEELSHYPPAFRSLAEAKAGLTGLSQVSGASGLPFAEELALDAYYLSHRSLWLDLKILARTLWIFVSDPTGV